MYINLKRNKIFWHFVVKGKNGQTILTSENYFSKSNAVRAAKRSATHLKLEIK